MADLVRQSDFEAETGQPISGAAVDAEFDQILARVNDMPAEALASNAVETAKIADGAVAFPKLAAVEEFLHTATGTPPPGGTGFAVIPNQAETVVPLSAPGTAKAAGWTFVDANDSYRCDVAGWYEFDALVTPYRNGSGHRRLDLQLWDTASSSWFFFETGHDVDPPNAGIAADIPLKIRTQVYCPVNLEARLVVYQNGGGGSSLLNMCFSAKRVR
jgi:hypothetical protein